MKTILKYLLFCFLYLVSYFSFALPNNIDSLLNLLKTDKDDTIQVNHFSLLLEQYYYAGNYDSALYYGNAALMLARQLNFAKGIAQSYNNAGGIYYSQGNYDKALENYFASLKIRQEIGNKDGIASSYSNIGNIYYSQGNYDKALENYIITLKIRQELSDKKGIANVCNNIGEVYRLQGNYKQALENHFASLKIKEEINDQRGIAASYNNIGVVYDQLKNYDQALENYFASLKIEKELGNKKGITASYGNIGVIYDKQGNYDKALENHLASLKIRKEIGDKDGIASTYHNIGNIYKNQGNYENALENYFAGLKILEETGNQNSIAASYINIGFVHNKKNNYREAITYLQKGLQLSKEIGAKDLVMDAYAGLSETYIKNNDFKNAYEYHQLYSQVKDSLFNEESSKQIAEMSTKYESEKKQKEIELQKSQLEKKEVEIKQQNTQKLAFAGGFALMLLLALVIFRGLKQKQKANLLLAKQKQQIEIKNSHLEKANIEIGKQKDEIEIQRNEIAHKNKDLTDSINYAQRIQAAILTSEQYLNDMFLPEGQTASHFILYKPKDIVAGDFYWAYSVSGSSSGSGQEKTAAATPAANSLCIWVTADCTGHGVPGAFMSMIGNSLLNEIVVEKGIHEPDEILNQMRVGVIKALGQGVNADEKRKDGMDATVCVWNKQTNKLAFAGANNSLWLVRKESSKSENEPHTLSLSHSPSFILSEIEPDSQPVGQHLVMNPFTKREIQLLQGDTLYTFTDGYCDQFGGPKGKKFKYKPFKELLISIQQNSMPEQKQIINRAMEEWKGALEQIDDICIVGVKV